PSASWSLWPRSSTGARRGEQQAQARMATAGLAGALADFAGAGAADARSDGPCWMLAAVAKRRATRLLSDVLAHDPAHEDRRPFLGRLPTAVTARAVTLGGMTSAGAARSP